MPAALLNSRLASDDRARQKRGERRASSGDRTFGSRLGMTGLTLGITAALAAGQSPAPDASGVGLPDAPIAHASASGEAEATAPPFTPAPAPAAAGSEVGSAISVQLNLDFTNAYFYRGIRQQDKGLIIQPAARVTARVVDGEDLKLDGFIGTWNSFGPNGGTRTGGLVEEWYESDIYAGFTLSGGKLSLTTSYTFLTSPSDAFQTVEELGFTLALDDSEWLEAWALKPYATLAIETGANGSDSPDLDTGAYLELGIGPGFSFDAGNTAVSLTFPVSIGLSLADYYQDSSGEDDTFGFAQFGARASIPLGEPGRLGAWTLNTGVSMLLLGDHNEAVNKGDDTQVIGTVGVQWNF
jgi:hypothetical protein